MPLRCSGARYVRTAPNHVLSGAATASVSFWLRLHAGSGNVPGGRAYLLAREYDADFGIWLDDVPGKLCWAIRNADGEGAQINYSLPLIQDATYHVAATWESGAQKLYVNGSLVNTRALPGALITRYTHLQLGPDIPGLDLTLDDPTVWHGHALTEAEVRALRDRIAAPQDIATGSIVWRLSLDGAAGAAAAVGDAGLDGLGSSGSDVAFVSTPAPIYAGGAPAYEAPRPGAIRVGPSGKTLIVDLVDPAGRATDVIGVAAQPAISVNGGAPITLAHPIWGVDSGDRAPYIIYPLPQALTVADVVTFSAPDGWATTVAGSVRASAADAVANVTGGSLMPPFAAEPKTMTTGWNPASMSYANPVLRYANIAKQGSPLSGFKASHLFDVDGYPTFADGEPGEYLSAIVNLCETSNGHGDGSDGWPGCPGGMYTLKWDGPADVRLASAGPTTTVTPQSETLTGAADNTRTYLVAKTGPEYFYKLRVLVMLPITAPGQATNIRVYPPGVATDGSQKFHPEFLRMLAGAKSIRFMGTMETNESRVAEYDHLTRPTAFTYGASGGFQAGYRWIGAAVAGVGPYNNAAGFFSPGVPTLLVTTAGPHGLATGQTVTLSGLPPVALAGGGTADPNGTFGPIYKVSDTALAFDWNPGQAYAAQASDGTVGCAPYAGMPVADMIELCATVGADPWLCVPHAMSDAGVAAFAAEVAALLPPGSRCRVEYSNETWNWAPGFNHFHYVEGMARLAGTTGADWYAKRAGEVHALFRAAFAVAGRDPADVVRVFGSQLGNVGRTEAVLAACAARGLPVDEVAIAPYLGNGPNHPSLAAAWESMDVEQLLDATEMYVQHKWFYARAAGEHRAAIDATYPAARLVCYEGGTEAGAFYGPDAGAKGRAWGRHPRIRGIVLQLFQQQQDQGCTHFEYLSLDGTNGEYAGYTVMWCAYVRWDMPAGKGDGSDGKFDNRADFEDLDRIVSVVGQAIDDWEALADGEAPALSYSLSGPASLRARSSGTLTLTPSGDVGRVAVTLDDGGAGGAFTPNPVVLAGAESVSCAYVPAAAGIVLIRARNGGGLLDPAPLEADVLPAKRVLPPVKWYPGLKP